jgi:hypothetical protein
MDMQLQTLNWIDSAPAYGAYLIAGLCLVLIAALLLAWRRQTRLSGARLAELEARQLALAAELHAANERSQSLAAQIGQINLELGRVDGAGLRLGLREAIALSRRGADSRELVHTCGIGDGEARLIALMHGRRALTATAADDQAGSAVEAG